MTEELEGQEGWEKLEGLLPDPTAEEVYTFVEKVLRFQNLFKPGWLEVHECVVTPLENGAEEYSATLLARQRSVTGRMSSTDWAVVRARFVRAPRRDQNARVRFECTHLSIGLMNLTQGNLRGRGTGLDITYSAFTSTQGHGMHNVRIRDFPNGWRRTLRYAALAKVLEWQLEQQKAQLNRCRLELESAQQAATLQEGNNS